MSGPENRQTVTSGGTRLCEKQPAVRRRGSGRQLKLEGEATTGRRDVDDDKTSRGGKTWGALVLYSTKDDEISLM